MLRGLSELQPPTPAAPPAPLPLHCTLPMQAQHTSAGLPQHSTPGACATPHPSPKHVASMHACQLHSNQPRRHLDQQLVQGQPRNTHEQEEGQPTQREEDTTDRLGQLSSRPTTQHLNPPKVLPSEPRRSQTSRPTHPKTFFLPMRACMLAWPATSACCPRHARGARARALCSSPPSVLTSCHSRPCDAQA